jgi:hypothetical protein
MRRITLDDLCGVIRTSRKKSTEQIATKITPYLFVINLIKGPYFCTQMAVLSRGTPIEQNIDSLFSIQRIPSQKVIKVNFAQLPPLMLNQKPRGLIHHKDKKDTEWKFH